MKNRTSYEELIQKIDPQSYWIASTQSPSYPCLEQDTTVEVAIVGGGIVGITAAYLLSKAGVKVAVLEADQILLGTTGHTTGKITSQHGLIYSKLKSSLGQEKAQLYAEANQQAIQLIQENIQALKIDCQYQAESAYVYTLDESWIKDIEEEVILAKALGIPAAWKNTIPLPLSVKCAIEFKEQAQFHPLQYLLALAESIGQDRIFQRTRAIDILNEEGQHPVVVLENKVRVTAEKILITSHFPFYDKPGLYFARIYPERSYALAIAASEPYPGGMYISAEDPTRSLRSITDPQQELIIVGGEHHKTGHGKNTMDHYINLAAFAEQLFTVEEMRYRWSAQDCMSLDNLPYIGNLTSNTPNVYVATGFGKWGMTNGTIGAALLADLVLERENPYADLFSPSRTNLKASASAFITQGADVAYQFIAGKLSPDKQDETGSQGRTFWRNGQRVGVYQDENKEFHLVDTTCTHLGCELKWNQAETSWDCPCHGSRFNYKGEIIQGPALKPLIKMEADLLDQMAE